MATLLKTINKEEISKVVKTKQNKTKTNKQKTKTNPTYYILGKINGNDNEISS